VGERGGDGGRNRRGRSVVAALAAASLAALAFATSASAAPSYPEAVVLLSGFDTKTPFTTPNPACNGKEGEAWDAPSGIAGALKAAGKRVFTAPVHQSGETGLPTCSPEGPAPPLGDYVDSNGELDANGRAFADFLAFLRDEYGVRRVDLVAHSDGGLWSRSAISQDAPYAGLSVLSLTTLGTPHTGSFVADLAIETEGGKCDLANEDLQLLCRVLRFSVEAIIDDIGQKATEELTNDYLATWNPRQTIGSCPVTGIAGTYVNLGRLRLSYYLPDDGLVGEASALNHSAYDIELHEIVPAPIPNFRVGGAYPVVHGSSMSELSSHTLLNTQQISDKVNQIVSGVSPAGPACNVDVSASASASRSPAARPAQRLPLTRLIVPGRRGRLPVPNREDAVILRGGARVTCGGRPVRTAPLLGERRLWVGQLLGCHRRLRVRGGGRAPRRAALLIRRRPHSGAILRLRGDRIHLRLRGVRAASIRVLASGRRGWRRVRLDRHRWGTLSHRAKRTALRLRIAPRSGGRSWTATAVLRH
jgi:triacylglycerol lipase